MNAYRVKEIMWLTTIVAMIGIALSGCSTTQKTAEMRPLQFCHTSKTVEVQNGSTVDSKTVVECNDNQVDRVVIKRAGLAKNCGVFRYWVNHGNSIVWKNGVSCQKPNGDWEIIDTDYR